MVEQLSYPIHQRTLGNGLRVVVSPDHSVPVVAVNLWYDVGSRDERPGEYGWAHLFEHLMFSGSAHVATGEHLNALQAVGGSVNATTWFDRTNYFETVPVGALDLALWLEADRLASLPAHLTDESVETQREVVKEEKRQRYDNVPYGDALPRLVELIFGPDHPYGHTTIGSMANIDAATVDRAATFFGDHYRPDNAVLTLVGDLSVKDAFKRVDKYFGKIGSWNRRARVATPPLPAFTAASRHRVDGPVPAASSYFAWRLPERDTPDFDACDLALAVLGAGQTSRLHQKLVRDQQIATGAGSSAMPLIGGTSFGIAQVRSAPQDEPEPAATTALVEIDRLVADGPTDQELARVKAQYAREWLTGLASFDGRADTISCYATFHDDPDRINRRLAEIDRITTAQVAEAGQKYLGSDQLVQLDYHQEAENATR